MSCSSKHATPDGWLRDHVAPGEGVFLQASETFFMAGDALRAALDELRQAEASLATLVAALEADRQRPDSAE